MLQPLVVLQVTLSPCCSTYIAHSIDEALYIKATVYTHATDEQLFPFSVKLKSENVEMLFILVVYI
jgi:hypothetical protein